MVRIRGRLRDSLEEWETNRKIHKAEQMAFQEEFKKAKKEAVRTKATKNVKAAIERARAKAQADVLGKDHKSHRSALKETRGGIKKVKRGIVAVKKGRKELKSIISGFKEAF